MHSIFYFVPLRLRGGRFCSEAAKYFLPTDIAKKIIAR